MGRERLRRQDDEALLLPVSDPSPWTYRPGESLSLLTPEAMCQGPCVSDDDIYAFVDEESDEQAEERLIREYFEEQHQHLWKVAARHAGSEHSRQVFVVYRDILGEIETYVRTGRKIDLNGLWARARWFEWDWEHRAWMHLCSKCYESPSFADVGAFGGGTVAGFDPHEIFNIVIRDEKPDPAWWERALKQVLEVAFVVGTSWPMGAPRAMAARGGRGLGVARAGGPARIRTMPTPYRFQGARFTTRAGVGGSRLSSAQLGRTRAWQTGAQRGEAATPATIRAETVEMEAHPAFQSQIDDLHAKGFEVHYTNLDPHVAVTELVDAQGNVIGIRREVYLQPGMRYLDFQHELGHVRQLERFDLPPATKRYVRTPQGVTEASNASAAGVLTKKQNAVFEYHNRLSEFVRLKDKAPPAVLRDELNGINTWRIEFENMAGVGRGNNTITRWAQEHFPEIPQLEREIAAAGYELTPRTARW